VAAATCARQKAILVAMDVLTAFADRMAPARHAAALRKKPACLHVALLVHRPEALRLHVHDEAGNAALPSIAGMAGGGTGRRARRRAGHTAASGPPVRAEHAVATGAPAVTAYPARTRCCNHWPTARLTGRWRPGW
jgi:hypothetical protein